MFVPADTFEFRPVPAGLPVVHDFLIQNRGSDSLLIHDVEADCGCTAVDFTESIPPNGEGRITVRLDTTNYGGNHIRRYVEVFSNDPEIPELNLAIEGTVDKFVDIEPLAASLRGPVGKSIKTEVVLTPSTKYPFRIRGASSRNRGQIKFDLARVKSKDGIVKYLLTIENAKNSPGRYIDVISLETDSTVQPVLEILVSGDIFR